MKKNVASGRRADARVEGVLDLVRAGADTVAPTPVVAKDDAPSWHWLTALLLALLVHLAILALFLTIHREPPRTEAFDVQIVTLGDNHSEAAKGPADGVDDPASTATQPEEKKSAASERPPEGDRTPQTAQPEAPVAPAPATPPVPTPKPKPPVAAPQPARPTPPKVVQTPAPPRATYPSLPEPLPQDQQARTPDLRYDLPEARSENPSDAKSQDPAYASLPAHVTARLGAIGGGPVWQKGAPPKDAGMVPWGSDYWARMKERVQNNGRYPPQAAPQRLEGEGLLEFVIDRSGKLLTYRVLQSTGHYVFDAEIKRMIQWSDPLPPLPPEFKGQAMHIIIPVVFNFYS